MDIDFTGLAARIAADIQDLRGVVIVSRDGLVLGSHPVDAEAILRPAWLRFASLGDVEKGFVQFSSELWVYVRRGPYASFAVSNAVSRPGLLLDELENALLAAEEARGASNVPTQGAAGMSASRPRTPLHPDSRPPAQGPPVPAPQAPAAEAGYVDLGATESPAVQPPVVASGQPASGVSQPAPATEPQAPQPGAAPPAPAPSQPEASQWEDGEVDRVALAQEFAQLLGESGYDDEDSEL